METMLGISTSKKHFMFLIIVYGYCLKKLERSAEQVLCGNDGGWGEREGVGSGGEMAQTIYAHMNK
jgi:hypothetical protein